MRPIIAVATILSLCIAGVSARADNAPVSDKNKTQLRTLLANLKAKAAESKPTEARVAVPTASAGARGAQMRTADRFAILWPGESISPLTALATTMTHSANKGEAWSALRTQLAEFSESFPEYRENSMVKNLDTLLKTAP